MGPTEWFLIIWVVSAIVWELVSLVTGWWEPISPVLSRLPTWAVLIIVLTFAGLSVHWWYYQRSVFYRQFMRGLPEVIAAYVDRWLGGFR